MQVLTESRVLRQKSRDILACLYRVEGKGGKQSDANEVRREFGAITVALMLAAALLRPQLLEISTQTLGTAPYYICWPSSQQKHQFRCRDSTWHESSFRMTRRHQQSQSRASCTVARLAGLRYNHIAPAGIRCCPNRHPGKASANGLSAFSCISLLYSSKHFGTEGRCQVALEAEVQELLQVWACKDSDVLLGLWLASAFYN